jgi:hypothetical protein
MTQNVGKWDKIIRLALGVLLFFVAFLSSGSIGELMRTNAVSKWVAVVIGAYLFITAIMGTCFIYSLCKISTNKQEMDMSGL